MLQSVAENSNCLKDIYLQFWLWETAFGNEYRTSVLAGKLFHKSISAFDIQKMISKSYILRFSEFNFSIAWYPETKNA
jgi:hypothetical protein